MFTGSGQSSKLTDDLSESLDFFILGFVCWFVWVDFIDSNNNDIKTPSPSPLNRFNSSRGPAFCPRALPDFDPATIETCLRPVGGASDAAPRHAGNSPQGRS
ncbi:hypothetical protein BaRGS_00013509 [Batillaria attramentaria]|uniref:Uncharacterized protein n=1 Tax=Batillaria attramentaria TaxID=370345 RepID=A0ABD0L837_9CAEN